MTRSAPLRRKTALKRSVPLRRVSKARRAELAIYAKLAPSWLANVPFCEMPRGFLKVHEATEIHHMRGRRGSMLNDTRYFLAVCRECHQYIHDHPNAARKLGVLQF